MARDNVVGASLKPRPAAHQTTLALLAVLAFAGSALAQLPVTELNTIYPPGGKQGSQVEVTLSGGNQDDLTALLFNHQGIKAQQKVNPPGEFDRGPRPVNNAFTVAIAADVPPGRYEARAVGRFGASNPRVFVVGARDELLDDGKNKSVETSRELPLGVTVSGRVDGSSVDYYQLALKAGQRVLVECLAGRIDSRMDATLVLYGPDGQELDLVRDIVGRDPLLDFTAAADGAYVVGVYDFIYGGGAEHFYRLTAHTSPHIDYVMPPAGLAGATSKLIVYGRNLPGGAPADGLTIDGAPLEQLTVDIPIRSAGASSLSAAGRSPSTAAIHCVDFRLGDSNAVKIGIATAPVIVEQGPNDTPAEAQQITAPCEFAGQFYPADDEDWVQFDAKKGEVFWIEVIAHRLGLDCDPKLIVTKVVKNEKGEETVSDVAQVDDPGDRNGRIGSDFDTSTDDPAYRFTASDDAVYRVLVRDNFGPARSDPRLMYRLQIRREHPDFHLTAVPLQTKVANANQVLMYAPVLRRGGTTMMRVDVERQDGFSDDIEISAENLPAGVACRGAVVDSATRETWLVFSASEDAAAWCGPIRIVGKSRINGQPVERKARGGAVVWGTGNRTQDAPEFRLTEDVVLSVTDKETHVAFAEVGDGAVLETSKGGKIDVPVKLARRNEFKENVKLVATGLPNEVKPGDITINGDKTDGTLAIAITNTRAKPGIYTFYLRGDTKAKLVRNPEAIAEAEADQKHVTELVAKIGEEVKQVTTAKDAAVKAAAEADNAAKQAEQAKTAAAAAAQQAVDALAKASAALVAAQQAAEKDAENQQLKDAAAAAQKAVDEATAKSKQEAEKLAAAEQALADAQNKAKAAADAKTQAEAAFNQAQEKQKRGNSAKQAVDKRVADEKKANAAKDVNFALVSTPIKLRVVETPLGLSAAAPQDALKQGAKIEVPVTIERKYGFTDAVEITLEAPRGVGGVSAGKVSIPKDQTAGKLELNAAANATEGRHAFTVKAKAKFNNVDVESSAQLSLNVEKTEPAAQK